MSSVTESRQKCGPKAIQTLIQFFMGGKAAVDGVHEKVNGRVHIADVDSPFAPGQDTVPKIEIF